MSAPADNHAPLAKRDISLPRMYFYSLLVLALVFITYLPISDFYFTSDDFGHLAFAAEHGLSLKSFFATTSKVQHVQPVFRLVTALEYRFFGDDPGPYYLINILVHLANTALVILVLRYILSSRMLALLAGLLFGVSASHWRVPMWITTQVWMLGTTFFLLSTLFFILYLRSGRRTRLALSAVWHLLMLLSFSWGVQVPVMFFALYWVMGRGGGKAREPRRGLLAVTPFIVNVALYLLLRQAVTTRSVIDSMGGAAGAIANLPKALLFMFGGIYEGFALSFTGAYFAAPHIRLIVVLAVIGAALLLTDWSEGGIRARMPLIICLVLWVALLYFSPTLPRIPWGYRWFIVRPRYRYITCIPAAAIAILWFGSLRPFTRVAGRGLLRVPLMVFFALVICANMREVGRREMFVYRQSSRFRSVESVFLAELRRLLREEPGHAIVIRDKSFSGPRSNFAGWAARPGWVCDVHLSRAEVGRVEFIAEGDKRGSAASESVYFVEKGTGRLKPLAGP